jgi:FAD/FMN-containing dehydrogenase
MPLRLSRVQLLNKLTDDLIQEISKICPSISSDTERYSTDWFGRQGYTRIVSRPDSIKHLSAVMSFCNSEGIGVNVIGGNTGLVGSCLSGSDEVVVSLEKLNRILDIDPASSIATVEGGVILENLQSELSHHNMVTPYDLGSRGSCTVGGNISTNAGGNNFIRYGPLRANVVGLEIVLASGEILDLMSKCRKDNTGYDLKQFFIGSEGTLGVITKAALYCPVQPRYKSVALLVGSDPCFATFVSPNLERARSLLGETLTAFEFMDSQSIRLLPQLPFSTQGSSGYALLVECSSNVAPIDSVLESFIEEATASDSSVTGVVASDITGMRKLWHYRDTVSSAIARVGPNLKYDLSLPHDQYYEIVGAVRAEFGSDPRVKAVVGYGHVGDGNIHLNIALSEGESYTTPIGESISSFVFKRVQMAKGSISAEHGIGKDKVHALKYSKSPKAISMMYSVKKLFDPVGILNPGRVLQ